MNFVIAFVFVIKFYIMTGLLYYFLRFFAYIFRKGRTLILVLLYEFPAETRLTVYRRLDIFPLKSNDL